MVFPGSLLRLRVQGEDSEGPLSHAPSSSASAGETYGDTRRVSLDGCETIGYYYPNISQL